MTRAQYYAHRHDLRLEAREQGLATIPFVDPLVRMRNERRVYLRQRRSRYAPWGGGLHPYQVARNIGTNPINQSDEE